MEPPPSRRRPNPSQATEFSSLLSDTHGQHRRKQRKIDKVSLQRARRYGKVEHQDNGRQKLTYQGVVFIYDPIKNREVTSFPSKTGTRSGTLFHQPIELQEHHLSANDIADHDILHAKVKENIEMVTSHSVVVVDLSNSMRTDDVDGAHSRSDAVWIALARDFLVPRMQQEDGAVHVLSIVCMKDKATVWTVAEPMDWVLYNRVLKCLNWNNMSPSGHGAYLPALQAAEQLLQQYDHSHCVLSLWFASDGRPSDSHVDFREAMKAIVERVGPRLAVRCIGLGDNSFETLQAMVNTAVLHGSDASLELPALNTASLSQTMTSLITSMTMTQTQLAEGGGRPKKVRQVVREHTKTFDTKPTSDWKLFSNRLPSQYVVRIWTWSSARDKMVYVRDTRCVSCYSTAEPDDLCQVCNGCFVCPACWPSACHEHSNDCNVWTNAFRSGEMVARPVPSFGVAMKTSVFGEGAERIVHQFRFLDDDDTFLGTPYVAKESRFVEEHGSVWTERMAYHEQFMRTQVMASDLADHWNATLDGLSKVFSPGLHEWIRKLPRIRFLRPLVVEMMDNGTETHVLVEEMLDGDYHKFNSNMGYVRGAKNVKLAADTVLETVQEECGEEEGDLWDSSIDVRPHPACNYTNVRVEDFPQAFSHFTYEKSKCRLLVVDLQGVLKEYPDGRREYILTDPAIHRRTKSTKDKASVANFGRTDRGEKGIQAFWQTHVCSDACSLFGLVQRI